MQARSTGPPAPGSDSPTPLSEALEDFLRTSGLSGVLKHGRVHDVWRRTVGAEIAQQTRILSLRGGVLEVAVASSALLNELHFHTVALLEDLRTEISRPFVSRLSFVLDPEAQDGRDG